MITEAVTTSIAQCLFVIDQVLTNREQAILIWLVLLAAAAALFKRDILVSFFDVLKQFCHHKILSVFVLSALYTVFLVWMLWLMNLWGASLIKETIYWWFGSGAILFGTVGKSDYLKSVLAQQVSLIALIAYLASVYMFPLVVEFIALPILLLLVMTSAYTKYQDDNHQKRVGAWLETILAFWGILLLGLSSWSILDSGPAGIYAFLYPFILGAILTALFLIFAYAFMLYCAYEQCLVRLKVSVTNKIGGVIIWRLLRTGKLNLAKVNELGIKISLRVRSEDSLLQLLSNT